METRQEDSPAGQTLRVLQLEDSPLDAELVLAELEEGGFTCEAVRVENEARFLEELRQCPDLILADFSLPTFDGISALRLAREHCPDVPFLFVSGALGEELAIETLKQGATDYVLKHRLERLVPSVRRALREAEGERERKRLEAELRQRAEQLAEADRRKDEFLAVLAHELRNPLAPIYNALHLMRIAEEDAATCLRSRNVIDRQVRHMSRLLDDLLDISRITRGKILLRREPADLTELVREVVEDHRPSLEERGRKLHIHLPDGPLPVSGDRTRIAQVAGNLLNNSGKFTSSGGEITVRLERAGDMARLSVRDNGCGINAAILPSVFEAFSQENRTRDTENAGLGLGLALVKGLVELHGGRVAARSDGPGMGAEFVCEWPLLFEAPAVKSEAPVPPRAGSPFGGLKVLVIDDNRDAADTMVDVLEISGCDVEVAYTGQSGLQAALRFQPEVILCDLGLPDLDGFTVAERLRENGSAFAPFRMIAVSGYGQAEDLRRSRMAGFDLHLTKPVDPQELQRVLRM